MALLITLTVTELIARQSSIYEGLSSAQHLRSDAEYGSLQYKLYDAVCAGLLEEMADIGAEIGRRVTEMTGHYTAPAAEAAELGRTIRALRAQLGGQAQDPDLTHVPMACTTCGKRVFETYTSTGGHRSWIHSTTDDYLACPLQDDETVMARVDA